ncbi:MAG: cytochrome c3 family protein [Myxococcota bacterium]
MQIFPRQLNYLPLVLAVAAFTAGGVITFVFWYYFGPSNLQVGYAPEQPVPYSHRLHAGELGIDCRYCHANVEESAYSMVPPTQTCMGCHAVVHPESARLAPVRESWATGEPIAWVRIHQLPDHSYFNHSAHLYGAKSVYEDGTEVRVAIGCTSCHGRIDQMEVVAIAEPIAMGWCLECHRNPGPNLRPVEEITNMAWEPDEEWMSHEEDHARAVNPPEHCNGCHR